MQLVESSGAGDAGYESLLDSATELAGVVDDERSLLSINYTSGTTGRPKGVMYHHRGAYLQALAMAFHTGLGPGSKFLWTLPMFHCNGWCFPWAVTAAAGTHVCLRVLDPAVAWGHIERDGITHLYAAPTVLTMLSDHPAAKRAPNRLTIATGGSAPSPTLLGQDVRSQRGRDSPVRTDRDVRAHCPLRVAPRMGRTARRGPAPAEGYAGRWAT